MKFTYEDLLCGEPIFVEGIGHFRSPKIKELNPTTGIGYRQYYTYINILSWDKSDLLEIIKKESEVQYTLLNKKENFNTFDIITLFPYLLGIVKSAFEFFIYEVIEWDNADRKFITLSKDDPNKVVGEINRLNYDEVRDMVLQMNYINLGKDESSMNFTTAKAKEYWEKVQKYLKQEGKKSKGDKRFRLSNIISKLSVLPTGYTLFNIYDLTVFQLYDQFLQYGYLRAMDLNERACSYGLGSKDFKFDNWLNPIIKS